jgi:phage I-like protein
MGPFELRENHFEQIIKNARKQSTDIVVDYEHNTLNPFVEKAPAAGWIAPTDFDIRDTDQGKGLFARIKWTPAALEHIAAGEFKYQSPVIVWNTRDRKTGLDVGASIPSVALTNIPFFDEIPALHLNSMIKQFSAVPELQSPKEKDPMNKEQLMALTKTLGLDSASTPEQIIAASTAQCRDLHALNQIAKVCGLEEGASATAIVASVTGITESVTALNKQVETLKASEAKINEIEAEARFSKAKAEGKVVAQNEEYVRKLSADAEAFDAWFASAPVMVPTTPKTEPTDRNQADGLTDRDRALAATAGMSLDDFAKFSKKESHEFGTAPAKRQPDPGFKIHTMEG